MSVCTTVLINVAAKEPLSQDIIESLKEQIGRRYIDDFIDITEGKINFRGTLNHGFDKTLVLLATIESYVYSDFVIEIGEIETEAIEEYYPTVYLFENKIFLASEQRQNAMYAEYVVHRLRDVHGNEITWVDDEATVEKAMREFYVQSKRNLQRYLP